MVIPKNRRPAGWYLFSIIYTIAALVVTSLIAVGLLSGLTSIYLFVHNEVLTDVGLLVFVAGFPVTYFISFLACHFLLKMPRFDYFSRVIVTNLITYGFFGSLLSVSRIPLFSRTVILSEFIVTTILLIVFHILQHRLYPKNWDYCLPSTVLLSQPIHISVLLLSG